MLWIIRALIAAVVLLPVRVEATVSISGTYVGTGPDTAIMLQLVESGSGQLTGHYEEVALITGPKLNVVNATVTGNVDGRTVVLNVTPTEPMSARFVFSGMLSNGVLNLSGGGADRSIGLRLSVSSTDVFNSQAAALSKKFELMQAAQDIEASKKRLEAIVARMSAFNERADQDIKSLPASEGRLKQLTQRMAGALARQQSIIPSDNAAVIRGQLGVAINQAGVESSQFHLELQSRQAEFQKTSTGLLADGGDLLKKCHTTV